MRILRKGYRNEGGQSLVEFALVLPIFLLVVVAIVDFGWIFMANITVSNAAREGARNYAVSNNPGSAIAKAQSVIGLSATSWVEFPVVDPELLPAGSDPKTDVKVTVTGRIKPLIGIYFTDASGVEVTSSSIMRIEFIP